MFFATNAAPALRASNGDTCLYNVPTVMRSSSDSTGQLIAPGMWSSANSDGVRTSIISSNSPSCDRFAVLNNIMKEEKLVSEVKLTQLSHGGGCGCKIAPALLQSILGKAKEKLSFPDLLVGAETSDDAAVYRLNDQQAIVATTDFFMPIVDDPFDFGRIAATNALSDVYAMGGTPIMALAIVGMPVSTLPVEAIRAILQGGEAVCQAAGIPLAGGHSIDSPEPFYGLVALGIVHPDRLKKNSSARAGDVLILGKGLGVGVLAAALKKREFSADGYAQLIAATTQLNTVRSEEHTSELQSQSNLACRLLL